MSRRRQATKDPVNKDAKFSSTLVSRLVNTVMRGGKKSTAQRIVYGAFDQIAEKNPASNPVEILQRAVDNAKPRIEDQAPPRRRRHLSGAVGSAVRPAGRAGVALAGGFCGCPQGHADEGSAGGGNHGSLSRAGERDSQTRRSSQDGAGQQGLCAFPLVDQTI